MQSVDSGLSLQPSLSVDIVPFKFKHFQHLLELHESQKYESMGALQYKLLPKIGFIAYLGEQPIAAGFLRRLEPNFAQIDTLVSNGHFGSRIRHEGVKIVVDSLINEAKRLKLSGIIALTKDTGTLTRAEDIGFHVIQDVKVIALALPIGE